MKENVDVQHVEMHDWGNLQWSKREGEREALRKVISHCCKVETVKELTRMAL